MACRVLPALLKSRISSQIPLRMNSGVSCARKGRVGLITLDRQRALNAINSEMVADITANLVAWRHSQEVGVVCIEGAGGKAFCAGGDVVSITTGSDSAATGLEFFYKEFQMNHLIGTYPKPYVALIHGITMGGGVGLSVHGKFRVATDKSLYAMPETAIGYFPDVGGSYFLSRLPQPYGMFLGLTGHRLKGSDLKHLGIATHYTQSDNLKALKQDILNSDESSIEGVLSRHESEVSGPFSLQHHHDMISSCFSDSENVPQIISRLQTFSSSPESGEFAVKLLSILSRMSPRSLVVTHRLLSLAPSKSYEECFAMEFNAAQEIVRSGEFKEGVRALLVDKDNTPKWNPSTLERVTEEMTEEYFVQRTPQWKPLRL